MEEAPLSLYSADSDAADKVFLADDKDDQDRYYVQDGGGH